MEEPFQQEKQRERESLLYNIMPGRRDMSYPQMLTHSHICARVASKTGTVSCRFSASSTSARTVVCLRLFYGIWREPESEGTQESPIMSAQAVGMDSRGSRFFTPFSCLCFALMPPCGLWRVYMCLSSQQRIKELQQKRTAAEGSRRAKTAEKRNAEATSKREKKRKGVKGKKKKASRDGNASATGQGGYERIFPGKSALGD